MSPLHNHKDPDTELNIPKTVKKAAIGWVVPAALATVCLGFVALVRLEAQDMLKDYVKRDEVQADRAANEQRFKDYSSQLDDLRNMLTEMDKKLDHLQYTVDYKQDHKQKDNP